MKLTPRVSHSPHRAGYRQVAGSVRMRGSVPVADPVDPGLNARVRPLNSAASTQTARQVRRTRVQCAFPTAMERKVGLWFIFPDKIEFQRCPGPFVFNPTPDQEIQVLQSWLSSFRTQRSQVNLQDSALFPNTWIRETDS